MGISSKRGQMKYVRLLLWGMYEEMVHSFFKVGQCPQGHNWSTYFATYHCTLVFPKYIYKIIFKTFIHLKHCQRHNDPKALSTFTQNNTFSSKQKLQQALKSWSNFILVWFENLEIFMYQLWQIVSTLTNPSNNLEKSM